VELVTERARYGATAAGHYALNLAAYSHSTSPIRRYADLLTQRQVTTALVGEAPPYSAAELDAMADWIATVSDRWRAEAKRDDEERPGAPAPSRRLAERNRALSSVAAAVAAPSPRANDDMAAEVIERATEGTLSISHIAAVLLGPRETWGAAQDACLEHLRAHPDQAMSVLVMLPQRHGTGTPEVRLEATPDGYRARASLHRGETAWYGRWVTAITKRVARHRAALSLLHVVAAADEVDVEDPPPEDVESGTDGAALVISPPPPGNHKGSLVEVAQQRQWRRPAFRLDQAGPPHAPVFRAWVKVVDGSHIHQAGPGLGRTRKAAEQVAAWLLLRDLTLHDESDVYGGESPTSWLDAPLAEAD
jgi:ribonuclease R